MKNEHSKIKFKYHFLFLGFLIFPNLIQAQENDFILVTPQSSKTQMIFLDSVVQTGEKDIYTYNVENFRMHILTKRIFTVGSLFEDYFLYDVYFDSTNSRINQMKSWFYNTSSSTWEAVSQSDYFYDISTSLIDSVVYNSFGIGGMAFYYYRDVNNQLNRLEEFKKNSTSVLQLNKHHTYTYNVNNSLETVKTTSYSPNYTLQKTIHSVWYETPFF